VNFCLKLRTNHRKIALLAHRKIATGSRRISGQNCQKSPLAQPANDPPKVAPLFAGNQVWVRRVLWLHQRLPNEDRVLSLFLGDLSLCFSLSRSLSPSVGFSLGSLFYLSQSLDLLLSRSVSLCLSEKRARERTRKKEKGEERREGRTTGFLSPFYFYSEERKT
jgi:hypothetical protein